MTCSIEKVIKPSQFFTTERHRHGDTQDIIETILYADKQSAAFIDNVECLIGQSERETMRNVWAFVRKNVQYRPDKNGHEQVKSPGALFGERRGDCKSFSIAVAALLRALGYSYKYRFVAYERGDVTHVYVIARGASGRSYIIDSVHSAFDEEVPYLYKRDIPPQRGSISGIGYSFDFSTIFLAAGAAIIIYSFVKK